MAGLPGQKKRVRTRERYNFPIHIKRMPASIRTLSGEQSEGFTVLNDFSLGGMQVFCHLQLNLETKVCVELTEPYPLTLPGEVRWCQETKTSGKVISNNLFKYRIGIQFHFEDKEVEQRFFNFYREITRKVLYVKK
jgi:hypothetical protein